MRRILLSILKVLVTVALLYVALRKVDFTDLASRIDLASFGWMLMAIAILFAQIGINALRWRVVSADCGAPLGAMQAMRYVTIGAFFNQTLPSSIGGDAVRLWLVARSGAGWRIAAYSIFVDRSLGLLALALLICATLPWSMSLITDPTGRAALIMIDVIALGGGAAFLLLGWINWRWLKTWWGTHHLHACSRIANRLLWSPRTGPIIVILSISIHVLTAVAAWCVVHAIDAPVSFAQVLQLVPPVMLVTMVPISIAGWGLREASMGLAFGYAGLAVDEGVNVSLLLGISVFLVGAIGGLVWVFSAEKAAKGDAPELARL